MTSAREKKRLEKELLKHQKEWTKCYDRIVYLLNKLQEKFKKPETKALFVMEKVKAKYNNFETLDDIEDAKNYLEQTLGEYKSIRGVRVFDKRYKSHAKHATSSPIRRPGSKCPVCNETMYRDYRGLFVCETCNITEKIPLVNTGSGKISQSELSKIKNLIKEKHSIKTKDKGYYFTDSETDTKKFSICGEKVEIIKEINITVSQDQNDLDLEDDLEEIVDYGTEGEDTLQEEDKDEDEK